jgi:imidazolonepropionase-like amidohydrolase
MMLAHVYLKKGCIVPKHSHENEQLTYILEGALKFWIGDDGAQEITVEAALRAYTTGGAYASFQEQQIGSLTPGRLADIVVIDRDLTKVPPETIRDARIEYTIVGGRVVFDRSTKSH